MFDDVLRRLGISERNSGCYDGGWIDITAGEEIISLNPATGEPLARVIAATRSEYERVIETSRQAFGRWRLVPAPARGEVVRQIGLALREAQSDLGMLVTLETGKIKS